VPGTTDTGNHGDDIATTIVLPFSVNFYDQVFANVSVVSNGNLQFTSTSTAFTNACLPSTAHNNTIYPHWDDLRTDAQPGCTAFASGCGIFTSITGTAPNRIFNIEWRAVYFATPGVTLNFEVRLYEGQSRIDFIYGTLNGDGSSATVGVQRDTGSLFTQFSCNTASLTTGMALIFTQLPCTTPTFTRTPTLTITPTPTRTRTPTGTTTPANTPILVGHVVWQGRPAQPNALQVLPITLTLKSASTEVNFAMQNTDASGFFTRPVTSLPGGVYQWRVQGPDGVDGGNTTPGFLARCGSVTLGGGLQYNVEMGLMQAGDSDNNNIVNVVDFNILKTTFGKGVGDPGYDSRADLTGDQLVNITDFNLQKQNFGFNGCAPVAAPND
jgi:hypothetical protein